MNEGYLLVTEITAGSFDYSRMRNLVRVQDEDILAGGLKNNLFREKGTRCHWIIRFSPER